jgi:glutamate-1-semialdehyde aminotransferase
MCGQPPLSEATRSHAPRRTPRWTFMSSQAPIRSCTTWAGISVRSSKTCSSHNRGVQGFITGDGPLAQILLTPVFPENYRDQKRMEDGDTRRKIMLGLFERGIFLNPMSTEMYLSLQHTEAHVSELCGRLDDTLRSLN